MEHYRLFELIRDLSNYKTVGDNVDYQIIIYPEEKAIFLLFQCSNGKRDWQNNFAFPVKPYKEQENLLWYHGGFCRAWKSANDEIMSDLISITNMYPSFNVVIAGWSLGGAMAVCAAEDFFYRSHKKSQLITFGAPKVCYGRFTRLTIMEATRFDSVQYRHVNDCVPYMPPFPGYNHVKNNYLGKGFNLLKLFNPNKYHCMYGDESLYEG